MSDEADCPFTPHPSPVTRYRYRPSAAFWRSAGSVPAGAGGAFSTCSRSMITSPSSSACTIPLPSTFSTSLRCICSCSCGRASGSDSSLMMMFCLPVCGSRRSRISISAIRRLLAAGRRPHRAARSSPSARHVHEPRLLALDGQPALAVVGRQRRPERAGGQEARNEGAVPRLVLVRQRLRVLLQPHRQHLPARLGVALQADGQFGHRALLGALPDSTQFV